ncbi:hypothetical protein [Umezawaea sp.]|uniref:hypothetical protein n=1 Tax=Umezawaea sp. TaxID=1955258 RepID=UPI002ED50632
MFAFTGKTVLVAGAPGALGTVLSTRFAQAGANTVVAARTGADRSAAALPGPALGVRLDVIDTPLAYGPDGREPVPVDGFAIPRTATSDEIADFILFAASDRALRHRHRDRRRRRLRTRRRRLTADRFRAGGAPLPRSATPTRTSAGTGRGSPAPACRSGGGR